MPRDGSGCGGAFESNHALVGFFGLTGAILLALDAVFIIEAARQFSTFTIISATAGVFGLGATGAAGLFLLSADARQVRALSSTILGSPAAPGAGRRPWSGTTSFAWRSFRRPAPRETLRREGAVCFTTPKIGGSRSLYPGYRMACAPRPSGTAFCDFARSGAARPGPTWRAVSTRGQGWGSCINIHDTNVFDLRPDHGRLGRPRPGRVEPAVATRRHSLDRGFDRACALRAPSWSRESW